MAMFLRNKDQRAKEQGNLFNGELVLHKDG